MKELLIVGAAAAVAEYARGKYGAKIEEMAVKAKIPPTVAHVAVVGGAAAGAFYVIKSFT